MTIWYYIDRGGEQIGSRNYTKVQQMSLRESDGKIYSCIVSEFTGTLLSEEWLG
jgi:hypothetical protein